MLCSCSSLYCRVETCAEPPIRCSWTGIAMARGFPVSKKCICIIHAVLVLQTALSIWASYLGIFYNSSMLNRSHSSPMSSFRDQVKADTCCIHSLCILLRNAECPEFLPRFLQIIVHNDLVMHTILLRILHFVLGLC